MWGQNTGYGGEILPLEVRLTAIVTEAVGLDYPPLRVNGPMHNTLVQQEKGWLSWKIIMEKFCCSPLNSD